MQRQLFPPPAQTPQFTPDDITRLRKQIHAFRLISKNLPLPSQLRQDLWASPISNEEKRLLDTPPSSLGITTSGIVKAAAGSDKYTETNKDATRPGGVQLVLPPLPQIIGFASPHSLLKNKLTATENKAVQMRRLLVPSITPSGIDVHALAQERQRRCEVRIEYRIKELAALPATVSDEQLDIGTATGQAFMRPGLIRGSESSARLKALIELKALGLRHKQRALRTEVVRSITRESRLDVAGNRSALRRIKKQSQREARLTEEMERRQRQERERREQDQHKQQLTAITNHGANLVAWHKVQQQRMDKLGRAVVLMHARIEREEIKRKERIAKERIQALKAGDEEAYLKLVDLEKDTRITHLLKQTDEYLSTLVDAVQRQQHSVAAPVIEDGETTGMAWLKESADMVGDDEAPQTRNQYYLVAHKVHERIKQQPGILVGGSLKEYQLHGLEWMVSLYNNRLNGILADEMGLGKTIQTISLVTHLIEKKQQSGPFLIIVPLSTITNWILEFEKWAPSVQIICYKGIPPQRRALQHRIRKRDFQVLLTTYDFIIKDRQVLSKINWVHMIMDEGHRMKNADSKLALTLTAYKTRYRLVLTGTPLQNNLRELWSLLNFVLPNIFSSAQNFDEWFNAPFANAGSQDRIELNEEEQLLIIKRLHKVLRPFLLRRLKKDVEVDLPDKVEHVIKCSMSAVQSRLYSQMLRFGTLFRGAYANKPGGSSKTALRNRLMQLRKICNHPFVFDEVETRINPTSTNNNLLYRTAGKFELLDRILAKLLATDHKVLIFFQMTQIMTIMQDFLEWRGIPSLSLDGSTPSDTRREYMHIFSQPDSKFKVFLLSTHAGGQGLNLQAADTVIIFDPDWNPSQDAQAMDRAHRIGQKNEVRILQLITQNSVEEQILARAEYKRNLDGKVIQAGKFDNKTPAEESEQMLRSLLKSEESQETEEIEDTSNSDEEINAMLARSDEERVIFARIDKERAAREQQEWQSAGNAGPPPERLLMESELPEEYLHDYDPVEEQRKADEAMQDKARTRKRVHYDDGLSEEQWLKALEDDNVDVNDVAHKKREAQKRRRKNREDKQHLEQQQQRQIDDIPTTSVPANGNVASISHNKGDATPVADHNAGNKRQTPTDEDIFEALFKVVEASVDAEHGRRHCDLFLELPSKRNYPDYYVIVRQPIAIKTIRHKAKAHRYATVVDFYNDWKLMFDNARLYNKEDSIVYDDACVLQQLVWTTLSEKTGTMLNTDHSSGPDKIVQ
ncbi:ATP-dependent DNA helicase Snf21 [Coemansia sp. RSA 2618]|nr:ATP-dependent DNA helicase Snf21 [Coemansia sp. RSA 2618]